MDDLFIYSLVDVIIEKENMLVKKTTSAAFEHLRNIGYAVSVNYSMVEVEETDVSTLEAQGRYHPHHQIQQPYCYQYVHL